MEETKIFDNKYEENNNKHLTNTKWIVWYHNPSDKNWNKSSYKDILELSSVEDFCVLKNTWNKCLPKIYEGMFFLMRKTNDGSIYPQWEDINNIKGGYWSFKVTKETSENAWFELMMHMIGECITENKEHIMEINGISISPKKNFCIIKIWNKNSKISSNDILSKNINFLNMQDVLYSNHENNIQKDNIKYKKENYKNDNNKKENYKNDNYKKENYKNDNYKYNNYKDFYKDKDKDYNFYRF